MHPCARCAAAQRTCCQRADVLVTIADVARIRAATGREDFVETRRPADPSYLEDDPTDPEWNVLVNRPDGTRRLLVRRAGGDCTFLGPLGCTLDEETRPNVCRLYPFTYDARGLTGEEPEYCPTAMLLPNGGRMTRLLDMGEAKAERWRARLYDELRADRSASDQVTPCASD